MNRRYVRVRGGGGGVTRKMACYSMWKIWFDLTRECDSTGGCVPAR